MLARYFMIYKYKSNLFYIVIDFFRCTHPPGNACEIHFKLKYEKSRETKENCQPP